MGSITSLLRRIVALLTALVMTMTGSDAIDGGVSLMSADYLVMPLAISQSNLIGFMSHSQVGGLYQYTNPSGYKWYYSSFPGSRGSSAYTFLMVGSAYSLASGSQVTVSWGSDLAGYYTAYGVDTLTNGTSGWRSNNPYGGTSVNTFYVYDQNRTVITSFSKSQTSVSFILDHDVSFLGIGFSNTVSLPSTSSYGLSYFTICISNFNISVYVPPDPIDQINQSVDAIRGSVADIAVSNRGIYESINNLAGVIGTPSAMEQFEQKYLESMAGQLDKVESMLSSDNPALPNNGDVAGFVSDIQDCLGLSGSSFNASEFAEATSAFGGSSATAAGGPWEFFTQAVADSLAGDTSSVGLADDDYIYAWLDQMQGRYSSWHSSSP